MTLPGHEGGEPSNAGRFCSGVVQSVATIPESRESRIAASRRTRRRIVTAIAILTAVWGVVMLYRMEIRAHWWAYRLQNANSAEQRQYYFACLASIGDKSLTALPQLLNDPRAEVRLCGVQLLRWCPSEQARELLLAHIADESDKVSSRAALELARRPDCNEAIPILEDMIRTSKPRAACMAVAAIERIGGPQAEAALLRQLDTADEPDQLAQVVDSLGMLASRPAIPALVGLLADERAISILPVSQRRIERVINEMQGQLTAQGIDPKAVLDATHSEATVASVAKRALRLIDGDVEGEKSDVR